MTNPTSGFCERVADTGAYCSSCVADIMAKALNPFYGGRRKKHPRLERTQPSAPPPQPYLFQ